MPSYATVKRLFDAMTAGVALLVLAPVLLLVALAIRVDSPGPALYRGRRVGLHGRDFTMLKFRTMVVDAERKGASSTSADDPRITRLGALLRRTKADELPQLINVLWGDMSWVGPRPQVRWATELYTAEERALLSVKPGITDYASLVYRNEGALLRGSSNPDQAYLERIAPGKMQLGLLYVRTQSLPVDLRILLATALAALGVPPLWCVPRELQHLDPYPSRKAPA